MSADNGYVIRQNQSGRYVLQMYFASDDCYPAIPEGEDCGFATLEEACRRYAEMEKEGTGDGYPLCEYGLSISVNA